MLVGNFKSYVDDLWIDLSYLNIFLGANSSGKSTALQALLALKQTAECNSPNIDLLLSGKYVTLGDFDDVINDEENKEFKIGVSTSSKTEYEDGENLIVWHFEKNDSEEKGVKLANVEMAINGKNYLLTHYKNKLYSMYVDGQESQILFQIINLKIKNIYFKYNQELNTIFSNFLSSILKELFSNEKISFPNKNRAACIDGVRDFYQYIFNNCMDEEENINNEVGDSYEKLVDNISELVKKFSLLEFDSSIKLGTVFGLENKFLNEFLKTTITKENSKNIELIINKYNRQYKQLCTKNLILDKYELISPIFWLSSDEKNDQKYDFDYSIEIKTLNNNFITSILDKIFYVGPIREKPQGLYNIGFESIPKYVGTSGAYFASVLLHENKEKEYMLPNGESEEITLYEALDAWLIHLNVASEVQVNKSNSFGFNVLIKNIENKQSDIMNVGIGVSQVLPVLITGLLSEEDETLIFEQPELHLHPYSQSRLADFFMALVNKNRKVMVETHSEYMLLRIRYHVLKENIERERIAVNFFENKSGTKVIKKEITSNGTIEYPDDFKDETQNLMDDLLNAMLEKKDNR
ncbi:AAA family ATPase [Thomasclavelia spiroformis]|uniref:AAA family ATPase n=1 Tax=Thomasclavelia spiroformis TaxID=29348 RepID=UPI00241E8051|nr:AAA family ATPase [Thomasclavelia spiroformis]